MKSFTKVINSFIASKNSKKEFLDEPEPLKNTLKTNKIQNFQLKSGSGLYNSMLECPISTRYDNLAQLVLEVDVVLPTHAALYTAQEYVAANFCKKIDLITGTLTLASLYPEIIDEYIDDQIGTPLFSILQRGVEGVDFGLVLAAPQTYKFMVPLPFFISEKGGRNFLNTKKLEQLYVRIITNDSANAMGITLASGSPPTITSMTYKLRTRYHDTVENNSYNFISGYPRTARQIKGSYSIYKDTEIDVPAGSTRATVLVNCPYATDTTYYCVVGSRAALKNVSNVSTELDGDAYTEENYLSNYSMYAYKNKAFITNQFFKEDLSILNNPEQITGLLTYGTNDHMFPCYKTLTFDQIPAGDETFKVIVYHKYYTTFEVDSYGKITDTTPNSGTKK